MQQNRITDLVAKVTRTVLFAMVVLAAIACARTSPEQALRVQVDAMQAAIEARDAGDVQALLAEDFIGNDGLDRRGARQLAAAVFLRHRDVAARFGPVQVELRGQGDATARFTVVATGGSGGLLPDSGQVFDVETGWRQVDGQWRLLNARWKPRLSARNLPATRNRVTGPRLLHRTLRSHRDARPQPFREACFVQEAFGHAQIPRIQLRVFGL